MVNGVIRRLRRINTSIKTNILLSKSSICIATLKSCIVYIEVFPVDERQLYIENAFTLSHQSLLSQIHWNILRKFILLVDSFPE